MENETQGTPAESAAIEKSASNGAPPPTDAKPQAPAQAKPSAGSDAGGGGDDVPRWADLVSSVFGDGLPSPSPAPGSVQSNASGNAGGAGREAQANDPSASDGNAPGPKAATGDGAPAATDQEISAAVPGDRPSELMVPTPSGEWRKATADEIVRWQNQSRYAQGADQRFREAKALREQADEVRREAESLKQKLLQRPWEALSEAGLDFDQIASERLYQRYQLENMDPETRQIYEENQRLQRMKGDLERQRQALEQDEQSKKNQAEVEYFKAQLLPRIGTAFEKAGVPDVELAHSIMSQKLRVQRDAGASLRDIDPALLVDDVAKQLQTTVKSSLSKMSGKALLDMLGKDVVNAVNAALVSEYKRRRATQHVPQDDAEPGDLPKTRRTRTQKKPQVLTYKQLRDIERGRARLSDFQ